MTGLSMYTASHRAADAMLGTEPMPGTDNKEGAHQEPLRARPAPVTHLLFPSSPPALPPHNPPALSRKPTCLLRSALTVLMYTLVAEERASRARSAEAVSKSVLQSLPHLQQPLG